jgi:putative chitinase
MTDITQQHLQRLMTAQGADARAAQWLDALNQAARACAIAVPLRQAAFLAQVMVESSELRHVDEALGYSSQRLRVVWPQRFPSDEIAQRYAHNPAALANKVYAGRMGNGDEASGDGWRYHGRGLIQLTGRDNYAAFARAMGIDALARPDLLLEPAGAALSAAWFWQSKGLNELADQTDGPDADRHFEVITRRINGGTLGLDERRRYWRLARGALQAGATT